MEDTHGSSASGHRIHDVAAERTSRELDALRRTEIAARHNAPKPPFAAMGCWIGILVMLFLIFAQWEIYPQSAEEQTNGMWALGFAIVIGGTSMRILFGNPGEHRAAALLMLASGVGLVLRGFLAPHQIDATEGLEVATGALTILGGLMCLTSAATEVEPPADIPQS